MSDDAARVHERVLVLRCQAGDDVAFTELVENYHARLHAYLRTLLGSADPVDDLLQDVWFDIFRSVQQLVDPSAFSAWAYRIAHNRAMRQLRKRRPAIVPLEENELIEDADDGANIWEVSTSELRAALSELVPEHREVLLLRFVDDMSYEDIASVVGCQVGTVRSRLHYAKCALRRALMVDDDERK